ncbi:hypothetical protein HDE_05992 [Halotydeus destructor]|nr:hypothetical protein HDE_05992 [Halotydeus destructor]
MKLPLAILFSTVCFCFGVLPKFDELDCDFSQGFCKYQVSADSNVTIDHDPETNWSYVTFGSGSEASFHSFPVQPVHMQCFQYAFFLNGTDSAIVMAQQGAQQENVVSRRFSPVAESNEWYNGTYQLEYLGYHFVVAIQLLRFNSTGNVGLTNFHTTPGTCP